MRLKPAPAPRLLSGSKPSSIQRSNHSCTETTLIGATQQGSSPPLRWRYWTSAAASPRVSSSVGPLAPAGPSNTATPRPKHFRKPVETPLRTSFYSHSIAIIASYSHSYSLYSLHICIDSTPPCLRCFQVLRQQRQQLPGHLPQAPQPLRGATP